MSATLSTGTETGAGTATGTKTVWKIDPSHSVVEFAVKHMMFTTVKGRFAAFAGEVVTVADDPTEGEVNFTIDADSIDTRDEKRDEHLRSNDFFGAGDHPKLVIASTRVEHVPGPTFRVHGDLTIKGVTRPVTLEATVNGLAVGMSGARRAAFTAELQLDRHDWGITWNMPLGGDAVLVGRTITLQFELTFEETAEADADPVQQAA